MSSIEDWQYAVANDDTRLGYKDWADPFGNRVWVRDKDIERLANEHGGFWGEHPEQPVDDWKYEVENGDTQLGYWEWVQQRLEHEIPSPPAGMF